MLAAHRISRRIDDHFDYVLDESAYDTISRLCSRWPDVANDCESGKDPDNVPEVVEIPTDEVFIATQEYIHTDEAAAYARDAYYTDAEFPPIVVVRCPTGNIVWNGHHRLTAHRLAGRPTIRCRVWGELPHDPKLLPGRLLV